MKHLKGDLKNIKVKLSAWKKATETANKLEIELDNINDNLKKILVKFLELIDSNDINLPQLKTKDKIFNKIQKNYFNYQQKDQDLHEGGADVFIMWSSAKLGIPYKDTLWNIKNKEEIFIILEYLFDKYPKIVNEFERKIDSEKFGL